MSEKEILNVIKDVYEIEWEKNNFSNNLRRFYGPGKIGDVEKKQRTK